MKRKISSKQTFFLRIILPLFFVVWIPAMTLGIYLHPGESSQPGGFLLPEVFILFVPIILLLVKRFKVVSVDERFLYVSNYLKEISIPLADIENVTEAHYRGHPVTIHLKKPSEFGEKITFLPKVKPSIFHKTDPKVEELKELAKIK